MRQAKPIFEENGGYSLILNLPFAEKPKDK